jgi:hypothetical protein
MGFPSDVERNVPTNNNAAFGHTDALYRIGELDTLVKIKRLPFILDLGMVIDSIL